MAIVELYQNILTLGRRWELPHQCSLSHFVLLITGYRMAYFKETIVLIYKCVWFGNAF